MRILLSTLVVLITILALSLAVPNRLAFSSVPNTGTINLKSASQLKTEAALYETAIREIGRIANLKLTTNDSLKKASDIVAAHIRNLRFCRSRLAALALNDSTFVSSVKAKTADSKSTEAFALELSKDPSSILKLNGAVSLESRMARITDSDTAMLKQVGEQLKRAAESLKSKAHHTKATVGAESVPFNPLARGETGYRITLLIAAAFVINSALGVALVAIVGSVVAVALIGRLISNVGTEEGRDKVAVCVDAADKRYQDCVAALPFFAAGCIAAWLVDVAACQFVE